MPHFQQYDENEVDEEKGPTSNMTMIDDRKEEDEKDNGEEEVPRPTSNIWMIRKKKMRRSASSHLQHIGHTGRMSRMMMRKRTRMRSWNVSSHLQPDDCKQRRKE